MANCYITLGGKRIDVLFGGIGGEWKTADVVRRTLNNRTYKSLGVTMEEWQYAVKVRYVPATGYAGYADLRTWRFDRTVAGNALSFTDEFNTSQGTVTLVEMSKPVARGKLLDGNAVYVATLRLVKTT